MKVLAIYPAFDPDINEMAMVWARICQDGDVHCTVIAGAIDKLKGHQPIDKDEHYPNLQIHRLNLPLNDQMARSRIVALASSIQPDVIFCAVSSNMPAALDVQKVVPAPIVLHTEYFLHGEGFTRRRLYLGIKWLRPYVYQKIKNHLLLKSQLIFSSDPTEFRVPVSDALRNKLFYLPWPHPQVPCSTRYECRNINQAVYIGSLSRGKRADVLQEYFSALLNELPSFRVMIIGPTVDMSGEKAINGIQAAGGSRVEIRSSCTRQEAISHIGSSLFILAPGKNLGWGLIGDAWSTGTPVISTGTHYDLVNHSNCMVAEDVTSFLSHVSELKRNPNLWNTLSKKGKETVALKHGIDVVATALRTGLENAVCSV